jgi:hypothetical protein
MLERVGRPVARHGDAILECGSPRHHLPVASVGCTTGQRLVEFGQGVTSPSHRIAIGRIGACSSHIRRRPARISAGEACSGRAPLRDDPPPFAGLLGVPPGLPLREQRPYLAQDHGRARVGSSEPVDAAEPIEYASRLVHAANVALERRRGCDVMCRVSVALVTILSLLVSAAA